MPRKKGAVNYKNDVLIGIVEEILPNGQIAWEAVATVYQIKSNKEEERDWNDIKKHWNKNLCNNMKKPTGSTGENGDRVCRCIGIEKKIIKKTIRETRERKVKITASLRPDAPKEEPTLNQLDMERYLALMTAENKEKEGENSQ